MIVPFHSQFTPWITNKDPKDKVYPLISTDLDQDFGKYVRCIFRVSGMQTPKEEGLNQPPSREGRPDSPHEGKGQMNN